MDDATVNRVIKVYTGQRDDLRLDDEQISRWKNTQPTESQKAELSLLSHQMERLRAGLRSGLAIANEMKKLTIETTLAKDDLERWKRARHRGECYGNHPSQRRVPGSLPKFFPCRGLLPLVARRRFP